MGKQKDILKTIEEFMVPVTMDKNHRYASWEHCYLFFKENRKKLQTSKQNITVIDHACLHLAFYLASWGMYRGSTDVLQKDYKIFRPIVKIIADKKYDNLYKLKINKKNDKVIDSIVTLGKNIEDDLKQIPVFKYKKPPKANSILAESQKKLTKSQMNPSVTLITKIILGTFACTPAYDNYVSIGLHLKIKNINTRQFDRESLRKLFKFSYDNKKEFQKVRISFINKKITTIYPIMKIIDMYFWQKGNPTNK